MTSTDGSRVPRLSSDRIKKEKKKRFATVQSYVRTHAFDVRRIDDWVSTHFVRSAAVTADTGTRRSGGKRWRFHAGRRIINYEIIHSSITSRPADRNIMSRRVSIVSTRAIPLLVCRRASSQQQKTVAAAACSPGVSTRGQCPRQCTYYYHYIGRRLR